MEAQRSSVQMTDEERAGVAAIIALQAMAGIKETEETALQGWREMSAHEREFTLKFFAQTSRLAD